MTIESYKEKMNRITTIILDVDGVLTDGSVALIPPDNMVRTMHTKDGFALQYAIKKGYRIGIITGGTSEMVRTRLQYLGIEDVFLRSSNKMEVYEKYQEKEGFKDEEVLYMGDDLPDYHVLERVGVSTCPKDAVEEIRGIVDYVSPVEGGKGCVRDIIEQTLKVQGNWFDKNNLEW